MKTRKIIVVDREIDRILDNVCDAALKFGGMQLRATITAIKNGVREEEIKSEKT
jgi:hypothetical protein